MLIRQQQHGFHRCFTACCIGNDSERVGLDTRWASTLNFPSLRYDRGRRVGSSYSHVAVALDRSIGSNDSHRDRVVHGHAQATAVTENARRGDPYARVARLGGREPALRVPADLCQRAERKLRTLRSVQWGTTPLFWGWRNGRMERVGGAHALLLPFRVGTLPPFCPVVTQAAFTRARFVNGMDHSRRAITSRSSVV